MDNLKIKQSKALKAEVKWSPMYEFPAIHRESAARKAGGAFKVG